MSFQALLGASRDTLRAKLTIALGFTVDASLCDVEHNGKPPPFSGQFFIALHQGTCRNQDQNGLSRDELYQVLVTLTYRTDIIPPDMLGSDLLLASPDSGVTPGLNLLWDAIVTALHMSYGTGGLSGTPGVLDLAGGAYNASGGAWTGGQPYSLASSVQGFVEPLRFGTVTTPETCTPDWFWAEGQDNAPTGVKVQLTFNDARRVQEIASA